MTRQLSRRAVAPLFAAPFLAACGVASRQGSSDVAATVAAPPSATTAPPAPPASTAAAVATNGPAPAAPAAASSAGAAAVTFRVRQDDSKATFRVREQLAGRQLPNDAIGTTTNVSGQLALSPEGALVPGASKITVDVTSLATDNRMRDQFIKQNTLQTQRFPTAEFVPTRTEGLPNPLPASGEHTFKLIGLMTVKGVQKEVTWDVTARRAANELLGKATTAVTFGDFGMQPPRVASVLSITDEIRLELDLAASQTA
ncbi:MAG TPA: YceI family protein [Chloroflexota bacterium]|nr:YceI family protein [Chloroflexota bacterium]